MFTFLRGRVAEITRVKNQNNSDAKTEVASSLLHQYLNEYFVGSGTEAKGLKLIGEVYMLKFGNEESVILDELIEQVKFPSTLSEITYEAMLNVILSNTSVQ